MLTYADLVCLQGERVNSDWELAIVIHDEPGSSSNSLNKDSLFL